MRTPSSSAARRSATTVATTVSRKVLEVVRACKVLREAKCESALINQFLRSGTSIGANIREAFYAHGKADFVAKLHIALKECSETEYWLELLIESGYYYDKTILDHVH